MTHPKNGAEPNPSELSASPRSAKPSHSDNWLSRFLVMKHQREAARKEVAAVTSNARASLAKAETALVSGEALLGRRAIDASDDFAAAHLLFREGLAWAALAVADWHEPGDSRSPLSFENAWNTLRAAANAPLGKLAGTDASLLEYALVKRAPFEARTLAASELLRETRVLRRALKRVTRHLRRRLFRLRSVRRSWALRWAAVVTLTAGVVAGALGVRQSNAEPIDLALNKPVTVSSTWGKYTDASKVVDGVETGIGFHTKLEKRPWLLIDLGDVHTVSELRIFNRDDCCLARTAPLVVAVSTDGRSYRQVARREHAFAVWDVKITPTQARFVKLYIDRTTYFHLAEVIVR